MEFARNLAVEQRRRLVGSIMEYAEREVYPHLPPEGRRRLREKVLGAVGVYHDFVLDCLRASVNEDTATNDEALILLRQINASQAHQRRSGDEAAS